MPNDYVVSGSSLVGSSVRAAHHAWFAHSGLEKVFPAPPREKRRDPRFSASETRLWLQWWQDGEYLGRPARLINISRNGAMIISWVLLREKQRLRVYLEDEAYPTGIEATVLAVVEAIHGMHQIRLEFVSPCTDAFIKAAADGFESWLAGSPQVF